MKSIQRTEELYDYVVAHGSPPDDLLERLAAETLELGGISRMQIDAEQGAFLTWLTRALGVRHAIEIGTFTGYSSICIARGLAAGGTLLCLDVSDEWTQVARRYWAEAGLEKTIELRIAPALDSIRALPREEQYELAFIDADKTGYAVYLEEIHPRLRAGGVVLVDNVLWNGAVVDPDADDPDTEAIRAFNDSAARDERFDTMMLGRFDGLSLLRKR
ncbi:MAG: O-methyltransferase [Planctomycetota bacterium]|jgi:caffeoyl-CoA O-methyltransferase|nr:SAM-dependent methyltransferase [Deltaproteobacteria bacterium]MDP6540018.1 O-methyltransferase [Planctomycetota bacterium]